MNKEDKVYPSMVIRSQAEAIELLEKENKDLQQENQQLKKEKNSLMTALNTSREKYNNDKVRYRRKYKNLKKQKDDVVEYIKKYLHEHVIDDLPDEESKFEKEGGIPIPNAKEILLRMLGEIDDK